MHTRMAGPGLTRAPIVVLALLLSPLPVAAQNGGRWLNAVPETAAGAAANRLLHDFNSGALDQPRWIRWRQLIGPATIRFAQELHPGNIRVWVQGTTSLGWLGWEVRSDSTGNRPVDRTPVFWMGGGPPPELRPAQPAPVAEAEAARRLEQYFAAAAAADLFSGTVILTRYGQPVFQGAYNLANRERGIANRLETRFPIASVGKSFTAAAVAHLVADGQLRFSDTVGRWLPDYPFPRARSATVGQLLAHTAGLGRAREDWIAFREPLPLDSLVWRTAAEPEFAPGADSRYCNECFLVAGLIVERASGVPYDEFVRRNIFQPAGMTSTGWYRLDQPDSNRAVTYASSRTMETTAEGRRPGPRIDATDQQGMRGTPAGGAESTAPDLMAFLLALYDGRLFPKTVAGELFKPHVTQPFGRAFGYGFELAESPVRIIAKGGNAQGTSAQIELYPESGYALVVLSNFDSSAQVAAEAVRSLVLGVAPR